MSTLQDKTYRAMLRLEADKPDAISLLCSTLLTAWQAGSSVEKPEQFAEWLRKVTPICLGMLSTSAGSGNVQSPDPHLISRGKKEMRTNMEVKVVHVDQVRFSIHARNHIIISDQPAEGGGQDTGMTPPELLLASLGSCAAFYAVQYLKTRKLAEHGVEVTVTAEKLKLPARMGNFLIHVRCPVPLTEDQNQGMIRSIHQCLVHNTLVTNPRIAIELTTENPAINKV
jgi:putative redox protein